MNILEFDGTDVKYEALEPRWSAEEVDRRHRERVTETCARLECEVADLWDYPAEVLRLSDLNARDHRERIGLRRHDGKPLFRRFQSKALDKVADDFGIPTSEVGWEEAAMQALIAAPARGIVPSQETPVLVDA